MKRRILAFLLALALTLFTGCQAANTPSPSTTTTTATTTTTVADTDPTVDDMTDSSEEEEAVVTTTGNGKKSTTKVTTTTTRRTMKITKTKKSTMTTTLDTTATTITTTSATKPTATTQTTKTEEASMTTTLGTTVTTVKTTSTTKPTTTTTTTTQPTTTTTTVPKVSLTGKSALFVGDSIAYGHLTYGQGFAYCVKQAWGLKTAASGATSGAEVTSRVGGDLYVYNQLKRFASQEFDYVLLQGGVNDAAAKPLYPEGVPLGTLSNDDNYDDTTFAGALEKEIAFALETWPDAKIGYIITFDINTPAQRPRMREYVEMTRTVCEKWNIPTLDLYDGKLWPSEDGNSMITIGELFNTGHGANAFVGDGVHPAKLGYQVLAKCIGDFMSSLPERN